jgi:hypothetical protein
MVILSNKKSHVVVVEKLILSFERSLDVVCSDHSRCGRLHHHLLWSLEQLLDDHEEVILLEAGGFGQFLDGAKVLLKLVLDVLLHAALDLGLHHALVEHLYAVHLGAPDAGVGELLGNVLRKLRGKEHIQLITLGSDPFLEKLTWSYKYLDAVVASLPELGLEPLVLDVHAGILPLLLEELAVKLLLGV